MNMQDFLHSYLQSHWHVTLLNGDSGERKYSRVVSDNGSYILVNYPYVEKGFDHFIRMQKILKDQNFLTPEVLKIDRDKGLMLLEDIGTTDLSAYYCKNKDINQHKNALDILHLFQKKIKKLKHKFNQLQGLMEMIQSYQYLPLSVGENTKVQLFKEFSHINQQLEKHPLVPSHRDFHSRNIFVYKNQIYMIDFQDAGWYPYYYDLVSLIYDSYISFSQTDRQCLIQYYNRQWNAKINIDDLCLTFCQRGFKAVGSFMSFYQLRKQTSHLQYIKPTLMLLKQTLLRFKKYPYFLDYVNRVLDAV